MLEYPKEFRQNLEYRVNLLNKAKSNDMLQEAVKEKAAKDILYFFNVLLFTYDPRPDIKNIPFITYEFQDKYIVEVNECIKKGIDNLTEKSRDMGVSWMLLGVILHNWLFNSGFNALLGSYIEDLVDNWTLDSHFGRLEYLIERLPEWILPKGFDVKKFRTKMKLVNPDLDNTIIGYAPTERFSRAGRYSCIFVDEFAFWEHARSAWKAMGDATKCRICASTVNGKGNQFADLALKSNIKKFTLHWKLHPKKDEAWYENEKKRRTDEEVAQELDINYNKSISDKVYPEFSEWNYFEKQEYDPMQPLFVSWDFGLNDATAIIWLQVDKKSGFARVIDYYQNNNKTIDFYVPMVTGVLKGNKVYKYNDEDYEVIERHREWQEAIHYGDPTGDNENQTSKTSVIKQLREYGIYVNTNRKKFGIKDRIETTKLLIRRLKVDKDLTIFIDAIENARYPKRKDGSQATTGNEKPIHDWTSHPRTALEFFAVNEEMKGGMAKMVTSAMKKISQDIEKRLDRKYNQKYNKDNNRPKYKTCA